MTNTKKIIISIIAVILTVVVLCSCSKQETISKTPKAKYMKVQTIYDNQPTKLSNQTTIGGQ